MAVSVEHFGYSKSGDAVSVTVLKNEMAEVHILSCGTIVAIRHQFFHLSKIGFHSYIGV